MTTPSPVNPKFGELHDRAADAFATAAIFQRRAKKYKRLVNWLTFVGLAIPVAIGGFALANLFKKDLMDQVIWVSGVLLVVQSVFFLWSVIAKWPENLDYSSSANANNSRLSNQLKALAIQAASPPADFDVRYTELATLDDSQSMLDNTKDISDGEKVYGYRATLIQFDRRCKLCDLVPISMKMPFLRWRRCRRCGGPKKK